MENSIHPGTFEYEGKHYTHMWKFGTVLKNLKFAAKEGKLILRSGQIILATRKNENMVNSLEFFIELKKNGQENKIFAKVSLERPKLFDNYTNSIIDVTDYKVTAGENFNSQDGRVPQRRKFLVTGGTRIDDPTEYNLKSFPDGQFYSPNVNWYVWDQLKDQTKDWDYIESLTFEVGVKSLLWKKCETSKSNNSAECLKHGFLSMTEFFNSPKASDLTVYSSDKKQFPAHRIVLICKSKVFEKMFECPMTESLSGILRLDDFDGFVVEEFLRYIYTGQITNFEEYFEDLLALGHLYEIMDLVDICEVKMIEILDTENLFSFFKLAKLYQLKTLENKCFCLLKSKKATIFKNEQVAKTYLNELPDIMLQILKS